MRRTDQNMSPALSMVHLKRRHLLTAAATIPWWRSGTARANSSIRYDVIVIGGGTLRTVLLPD